MSATPGELLATPIEQCRGCAHGDLREALRMDPMPLAGQFCPSIDEARAAARLPLTWVQCARCALVQVKEDVDDRVLFTAYNYASSTVAPLVRHFEGYASFLAERLGRGERRVLEIGCNDGVLLARLPKTWHRVGVDPSDVARRAATEAGSYDLVNAPFSEALAAELPGRGAFDLVTGSNCLAHIRDLGDVFRGAWAMLREGGELFLEVHDLDATLSSGQWDTIYHEHKAEWSERSLARCLAPIGFEPVSVDRLALHGGLLRAGFRKTATKVDRVDRRAEGEGTGESFDRLRRAYVGRRETPVYREIAAAAARGESIAAYGASGRANVWLNQLAELPFRYVVDDSPLRANKWLPSVATPVVDSARFLAEPPAVCVITAWNYAADIKRKYPGYGGRWLQTFEG